MMYRDTKTTKVMTITCTLMLSQGSECAFLGRVDEEGSKLLADVSARSRALLIRVRKSE